MKIFLRAALFAVLPCIGVLHAELPPELKHTSEEFHKAMKTYDGNFEAQVKAQQDRYLVVLGVERKRAVATKRNKEVTAIDAEIEAVKAGPITGKAPTDLPAILSTYRAQYAGAPEKAARAVGGPRRSTRKRYLKWLDGMAAAAARGKSAELEKAVAGEKKRVLAMTAVEDALAEKEKKPDEKAKADSPDAGKKDP